MKRIINRTDRRAVVGAGAALVAVGAVLVGASVTSAAIDTAAELPADVIVEAAVVDQADDGTWYACTIDLGDGDAIVGEAIVGEVADAGPWDVGSAVPVPVDEVLAGGVGGVAIAPNESGLDDVLGSFVGEVSGELSGDVGVEIALPGPDEIRDGTPEECSALIGD